MSASTLPRRSGHAVVIGAGITGMVAARVLADHFEKVTLLERDRLPDAPDNRRGAPQASHPHTLLVRGRLILEQLFPGLVQELLEHGGVWFDYSEDARISLYGNRLPHFRSGVATVSCSRALLEWRIRTRMRSVPGLELRDGVQVNAPLTDGPGRVIGVRLQPSPGQGQAPGEEQLLADLVVDASGRGSHAPKWLEAMGLERPPETVIRPGVGYSTRWFRVPPGQFQDWSAIGLSTEFPHQTRGAAVVKVEGGRMLATLVGTAQDYPPGEEQEYLEFTRQLGDPVVQELVQTAEPLSPIFKFRGGDDCFRHYEKVKRWPERFVVMGDAVCVFNPVYAQGMTVGILGALLLGELVGRHRRRSPAALDGLAQRFQRQLARQNKTPWGLAIAEDSRWEAAAQGRASWSRRFNFWLQKQVLRSVLRTEEGSRRMLQVMHMLRSPLSLLGPGVLAQLLWRSLTELFRTEQPAAAAPPVQAAPPSTKTP